MNLKPVNATKTFDPIVESLDGSLSVVACLREFATLPGCLLLESSTQEPASLGRYSFLMADPFEVILESVGTSDPFRKIRDALDRFATSTIENLPPMQGGAAGVFSYDLNRSFESIAATKFGDFQTPALVVGLYDVVIAWDHLTEKAWLISQGFPETDFEARTDRARRRADEFMARLENTNARRENLAVPLSDREPLVNPDMPLFPIDSIVDLDLKSNFEATHYVDNVKRCIDYIFAGDVFQINLAQQLFAPATCGSVSLYERLRACNASTFGGYFDVSQLCDVNLQVISASPERFFSVVDRIVETRPIKGTRPRTGKPQVDLHEKEKLLSSEKERSENTMIVDLMRNDLSPVCQDDSICVTQWCELEQYRSVLHLVSAVKGKLRDECDLVDLLQAVFPGGSITGAPKVRAMEIIAELEPNPRGFYCGSMGYLGFNGFADLSILIRTITASNGWWQIPVGGGIVSQSDPRREYQETWTKAAAMLNAIRDVRNHLDTG